MPGQASSNFQGRGGRGGFGGGRGRGRGAQASGINGGRGGGGSNFGGARHECAPQQDSDELQECFKCIALRHQGKYAEHSVDMCPQKALFDSNMQDPELAPRVMQRLSERAAGSDNSRGSSNHDNTNKQCSGGQYQGNASDNVHAPVQPQHIPPIGEYRYPQPQPTGEYRYPPN
jgi:hypothetical protein